MKLYNTLTRKKEGFRPIKEKNVGIYVCDPTIYNYTHVGNARPTVVFGTLGRCFIYKGYSVRFISNFTDIDDKVINKAEDENTDFREITKKYIQAYLDNVSGLNFDEEDTIHPKATRYIDEVIKFIKTLEGKGAAYNVDGNVYLDITKAKDYGKLFRKNIDDLRAGARIDVNSEKKSPTDSALWEKRKEGSESAWGSPWGMGRPGWHLGCSVMNKSILGNTIDIHTGGEDLQFLHRENEIAQSETCTRAHSANYWLHDSTMTVDKEKIGESRNNFFLLKNIEKELDLEVIRLWLLSTHYKNPIDFGHDTLVATKSSLDKLYTTKKFLSRILENSSEKEEKDDDIKTFREKFERAMDDDINMTSAISVLFNSIKYINKNYDEDTSKNILLGAKRLMDDISYVLGILFKEDDDDLDSEIEGLVEQRNAARKEEDFEKADEIRDKFLSMGIVLKDIKDGVI